MQRFIAIIMGLVLAAVGLHVAAPVQADHAEGHRPSNRIQVEIIRVHVLDDADDLSWGELTYRFRLQRGSANCPGHWCTGAGNEFFLSTSISATTSQVRGIHTMLGGDRGLALYPGDEMRISFAGVEEDWDGPGFAFCPPAPASQFDDSLCGAHDKLGVAHIVFTGDYGIGTHTREVRNTDGDATFRVDYEIRQVPMANLQVEVYSRTTPLVGGEQSALCVRYRNVGRSPSGRFSVDIWVENVWPSGPLPSEGLWVGEQREQCLVVRVPAGTHTVGAKLEPIGDWTELNWSNNETRQTFTWSEPPQPTQPTGPIWSQVPSTPSPALTEIDLEPANRLSRPVTTVPLRGAPDRTRATITTDKTQYRAGEPIRICYTVPGPGPVNVFDETPDGRGHLLVRATDDGTGDCVSRTAAAPTGIVRLRLEVYAANQPTQQVASAETSFTVLP
jgi:hypothetical protein